MAVLKNALKEFKHVGLAHWGWPRGSRVIMYLDHKFSLMLAGARRIL